jgi:hypothetical protein
LADIPEEQNIMIEGKAHGIHRLVAAYADAFRIPENIDHYAPHDFAKAQRQFVRFCLQHGCLFQERDDFYGRRP